jgi:hypothetical protein
MTSMQHKDLAILSDEENPFSDDESVVVIQDDFAVSGGTPISIDSYQTPINLKHKEKQKEIDRQRAKRNPTPAKIDLGSAIVQLGLSLEKSTNPGNDNGFQQLIDSSQETNRSIALLQVGVQETNDNLKALIGVLAPLASAMNNKQ